MKWYLIKVAGSNGCVFDFSQAEVADENRLKELTAKMGYDVNSMTIEYGCYDERIKLHMWHLLADLPEYKKQHVLFIYSPTSEVPELSEFTSPFGLKGNNITEDAINHFAEEYKESERLERKINEKVNQMRSTFWKDAVRKSIAHLKEVGCWPAEHNKQ